MCRHVRCDLQLPRASVRTVSSHCSSVSFCSLSRAGRQAFLPWKDLSSCGSAFKRELGIKNIDEKTKKMVHVVVRLAWTLKSRPTWVQSVALQLATMLSKHFLHVNFRLCETETWKCWLPRLNWKGLLEVLLLQHLNMMCGSIYDCWKSGLEQGSACAKRKLCLSHRWPSRCSLPPCTVWHRSSSAGCA